MRHSEVGMSSDLVVLDRWDEVCGELEKLVERDGYLEVVLSVGRLRVPVESPEANSLNKDLAGMTGLVVCILRTNIPGQPYAVRIPEHDGND